MSEWQDIDTAPTDERVMLGKWSIAAGQMYWHTDTGKAFETTNGVWPWSAKRVRKTTSCHYFTHWKSLPEPPTK